MCITEAAMAWRGAQPHEGVRLARQAAALWAGLGVTLGPFRSALFQIACGDAATPDDVAHLTAWARACKVPGIGVQSLALLVAASQHAGGVRWRMHPLALAEPLLEPRNWDVCIDVMSVREALARLGVA